MSEVKGSPAEGLLRNLRRIAGDFPLSHRFPPAQWLKAAEELDLTSAQIEEAIASLKVSGFVYFTPVATEVMALTADGVARSDELLRHEKGRDVQNPLPSTREGIREDLDYWERRFFDGEPGSIWCEQVKARIDALRHRETRSLIPQTIVNNAIGPNSRNNLNSQDGSFNLTTETDGKPRTE